MKIKATVVTGVDRKKGVITLETREIESDNLPKGTCGIGKVWLPELGCYCTVFSPMTLPDRGTAR